MIINYDNLCEIIGKLFDLLISWYPISLGTQMILSDFIFDCVNWLYYKSHKNAIFTWWFIYWFSRHNKKRKTMNHKNDDNRCSQ